MPWFTPSDLAARLPDFDPADTGGTVAALIAEAEALVQAETGVAVEDVGSSPSTRVVYGSGTPYLAVDPHAGTLIPSDLAIASGSDVPAFVDRGTVLVLADDLGNLRTRGGWWWAMGWPLGEKITITATWGAAPPADLVTAARELVVAWYVRSLETTTTNAIGGYPPIAAAIIGRYQRARAFRPGGLL